MQGITTELGNFNEGVGKTPALVYQVSNSGPGRNAVLLNDEGCNVSDISFPKNCGGNLPNDIVAYGNSDETLTKAEIAFAATKGPPAVNTGMTTSLNCPSSAPPSPSP